MGEVKRDSSSCRVRKTIAHAQRSVTLLSPICGCAEPALDRAASTRQEEEFPRPALTLVSHTGGKIHLSGGARDFPLAVLRRVHIHCERSVRVLREVVVAAEGMPVDRIGDGVFRHSFIHRHGKTEADRRGRQLSSGALRRTRNGYAALFIPAPDPQLLVITLSLCSLGSVVADDVIRRRT